MKKFKKLSALLMASVITAGTVSSLSAGAISYTGDKRTFEAMLDDCDYIIPDENEYFGGCYISKDDPYAASSHGRFGIYKMDDIRADSIQSWAAFDTDMERLEKNVLEICPDAIIESYTFNFSDDPTNTDNLTRFIMITGFDGSLPYQEARKKDITFEQAMKLHDVLKETGEIETFKFVEPPVKYKRTYSCLTSYGPFEGHGTYDDIEKYISENNLKYHINYDGFFECINIIADEEASIEEYHDLTEQIYKDLNMKPYISDDCWSESLWASPEVVIDLHNSINGDANDDGTLSLADAITIMQTIGNPDEYSLTPQGEFNADISGDYDGITNMDALTVQRKLLHLE